MLAPGGTRARDVDNHGWIMADLVIRAEGDRQHWLASILCQ